MRTAVGLLASSSVLLVCGATGLLGTWGIVLGVVLCVSGAVAAAVAIEEREQLASDTPVQAALLRRLDVTR